MPVKFSPWSVPCLRKISMANHWHMRDEAQRVLGAIGYCTFVPPPPPRVRVRAMGKLSAASVINNKRRGVVWKCNSAKFYWWSIIDLYLMTWIHHSNFYFVQDYTISIPCLLNAICYYLLLCILTTKPVKYFYSYRFLVGMGDKQVSM